MESSTYVKKLVSNSGPAELSEHSSAIIKALYFSANWCVSCQRFTLALTEFYKKVNNKLDRKEIEIIYVSADESEDEFKEYYKDMPWLAVPFEETKAIEELQSIYQIEEIPSLVIVDEDWKALRVGGYFDLYKYHRKPQKVLKLWRSLYSKQETQGDNTKIKRCDSLKELSKPKSKNRCLFCC